MRVELIIWSNIKTLLRRLVHAGAALGYAGLVFVQGAGYLISECGCIVAYLAALPLVPLFAPFHGLTVVRRDARSFRELVRRTRNGHSFYTTDAILRTKLKFYPGVRMYRVLYALNRHHWRRQERALRQGEDPPLSAQFIEAIPDEADVSGDRPGRSV